MTNDKASIAVLEIDGKKTLPVTDVSAVQNLLTFIKNNVSGGIDNYDDTKTYNKNDVIIMNESIYKCLTNNTVGYDVVNWVRISGITLNEADDKYLTFEDLGEEELDIVIDSNSADTIGTIVFVGDRSADVILFSSDPQTQLYNITKSIGDIDTLLDSINGEVI